MIGGKGATAVGKDGDIDGAAMRLPLRRGSRAMEGGAPKSHTEQSEWQQKPAVLHRGLSSGGYWRQGISSRLEPSIRNFRNPCNSPNHSLLSKRELDDLCLPRPLIF